jgi:Bacterial Ig domain/PA14 domain/Secretion system C-terminal sorting domain
MFMKRALSVRTRKRKLTIRSFCKLYFLFSLHLSVAVYAQTPITINLRAIKDNTIYQRNTSNSNGAGEYFIAGTTGSPYFNHALIQFPVTDSIPRNAMITSVTLTLHLAGTSGNSGPYGIEMHRLLQDWSEGTSNAGTQAGQGAPASPNDATWLHQFFPSQFWTNAGGTYDTTVSSIQTVDGIGFYSWTGSGLVADVQRWVSNNSSNFGWLLKSNELRTFQAKKFDSRENIVIANRPALQITYVFRKNQLPAITITSPIDNVTADVGDTIVLNANASDADGRITKVEFFNSGVKFLEDTIPPYGLSTNAIEPGNYVVTAVATDDSGATTASNTVRVNINACTGSGSILGEGYVGIPGSSVSDLLSNPSFPNSPAITALLPSTQYGGLGENYGGRLRGYLCVPQTGDYTFYISADDQAGLWLSPDAKPEHKQLIAYTLTAVPVGSWTTNSSQKSAPIHMIKGGRYYIETLHKQGTFNDHLSLRWVLPNFTDQTPIPGTYLSPFVVTQLSPGTFAAKMQEKNQLIEQRSRLSAVVSPNPSRTSFTVTISTADPMPIVLTIFDATGKAVEVRKVTDLASNAIRIGEHLKAGIYVLEVRQGTKTTRSKLVRL